MSILSWILCYFGIGSEEGDLREEEREAREGRGSNKNQGGRTNNKPTNNRNTKTNTTNRPTNQRNTSSQTKKQQKKTVTLVANNGNEIDFTCYGYVNYRGKTYACMELIDSDDDGVLFFEYSVTRGGEENYVIVEDDSLVDKLLAEANRTLSR